MNQLAYIYEIEQDDAQQQHDDSAWMEFFEKKEAVLKRFSALSRDAMNMQMLIGDEKFEDAVHEIREYILRDVQSILSDVEVLCDERP